MRRMTTHGAVFMFKTPKPNLLQASCVRHLNQTVQSLDTFIITYLYTVCLEIFTADVNYLNKLYL